MGFWPEKKQTGWQKIGTGFETFLWVRNTVDKGKDRKILKISKKE